jgi:SAM-dependent methyltransferase
MSGTLGLQARLVRLLISRTQRGRFGPLITPQTFELARDDAVFASAERERCDGAAIFSAFQGLLLPDDLYERRVLDLGCGYGGRTVYYAETGTPNHVVGVEIDPKMVARCREFAETRGRDDVEFALARAEALPFPDDSFDVVLSYDVLEHVDDPRAALGEIARVLSDEGSAWLVFPTYLGARASHLDYLTRLPGLHRIFSADAIVAAVNDILAERSELGTPAQPSPQVGPFGRVVLPTLNGMSRRDAREAIGATGLDLRAEVVAPILAPESKLPLGPFFSRLLSTLERRRGLPELLIGSLAFSLVKPERPSPHRETPTSAEARSTRR